ncbi:MAG TPA: hypothetical protein DD413_07385 [Ruminococcus sp.]|nr:hypothetical protein [Ruminococcus sp.]
MRNCKKCGSLLENNVLFCGKCGAKQTNRKALKVILIVVGVLVLIFSIFAVIAYNMGKNRDRGIASIDASYEQAKRDRTEYTSYITYKDFIRSWNKAVAEGNEITNNVLIDESINYNFELNLRDGDVLKCETKEEEWQFFVLSEQNPSEKLGALLKIAIPNISKASIDHWIYVVDHPGVMSSDIKGFFVRFSPDRYSVGRLEQYMIEKNVVTEITSGYATTDVSLIGFKNRLKSEYEQYIKESNGGIITAEQSEEINQYVETAFSNPTQSISEYWHSEADKYSVKFVSVNGVLSSVGADIYVTGETEKNTNFKEKIISVNIYCTDSSLKNSFTDFSRIIIESISRDSGMKTITDELKPLEKGYYASVYDGIRYVLTSKEDDYSSWEIYPYEKYELCEIQFKPLSGDVKKTDEKPEYSVSKPSNTETSTDSEHNNNIAETKKDDSESKEPEESVTTSATIKPSDTKNEIDSEYSNNYKTEPKEDYNEPEETEDYYEELTEPEESIPPKVNYSQYIGCWTAYYEPENLSLTLNIESATADYLSGTLIVYDEDTEESANISFEGDIFDTVLEYEYDDDGVGNRGCLGIRYDDDNSISISNSEYGYNINSLFHWGYIFVIFTNKL